MPARSRRRRSTSTVTPTGLTPRGERTHAHQYQPDESKEDETMQTKIHRPECDRSHTGSDRR